MTESKAPAGFIHGFATAAIGLGILLGVVWLAVWGIEAAWGPDWRMPMKPLQSGGALVLIGWVLRMLLQSRGAKGAA